MHFLVLKKKKKKDRPLLDRKLSHWPWNSSSSTVSEVNCDHLAIRKKDILHMLRNTFLYDYFVYTAT